MTPLLRLTWIVFGRFGVITVPLTAYFVGREFLSDRHTTWLVVASFLSLFVLLPVIGDRLPDSAKIDERVGERASDRHKGWFLNVALWVVPLVVGVLVGTWHHDIGLAFTTWLTMTFFVFVFLVIFFPG